jgi:hypothetical protein
MKHHRALSFAIAVASAGWVAPLYLACQMYASYVTQEFLPQVQGHYPLTSFPNLQGATALVQFALVWVGLVVAGWCYWGLSRARVAGRA